MAAAGAGAAGGGGGGGAGGDDDAPLLKFPRTRHLFDAGGGVGRDDLLLTAKEAEAFLGRVWQGDEQDLVLTVEEKVDGANLGISLTAGYEMRFQNRSHFVTTQSAAQWRGLDAWVAEQEGLFEVLTPDRILYGEWLQARHSVAYDALPSYFVLFDIWDRTKGAFVSVDERDALVKGTSIRCVPQLLRRTKADARVSMDDIRALLDTPSAFSDDPEVKLEGVVLRIDNNGKRLFDERAKVVRGDFLEGHEDQDGTVQHWSKKTMVKNIVKRDYGED